MDKGIYDKIKKSREISINTVCLLTPVSLVFFLSNMLNLGLFTLFIDGIGLVTLKVSNTIIKNKIDRDNNKRKLETNLDINRDEDIEELRTTVKTNNYTLETDGYTFVSSSQELNKKVREYKEDEKIFGPIVLSESSIDSVKTRESGSNRPKVRILK